MEKPGSMELWRTLLAVAAVVVLVGMFPLPWNPLYVVFWKLFPKSFHPDSPLFALLAMLVVCAACLRFSFSLRPDGSRHVPATVAVIGKVTVALWVVSTWSICLFMRGAPTLNCAILVAPTYLLASAVRSPGLRAWSASALGILLLEALRIMPSGDNNGAYLMVPPAVCVMVILIARDRRRRLTPPQGICEGCGYNLTGNVSGVCPECGLQIIARCSDADADPDVTA